MSKAKLTPQQWDALGRFQRDLSALLDVEWTLKINHFDYPEPSVEIMLLIPQDRDFQSLDKVVEEAFEHAEVPDYKFDGTGVDTELQGDVRRRAIIFYPIKKT